MSGRGMRLQMVIPLFVFTGDELHLSAFGPVGVLIGLSGHLLAVLGGDDFGPGLHLGDFLIGRLADVAA